MISYNGRTAVVLRTDKDSVRVMNDQGEHEIVHVSDIQTKIVAKKGQHSWDRSRHPITKDDVVKVLEGPMRGKRGTIMFISNDMLFLHNRALSETLGIFVEKGRNVAHLAAEMTQGNQRRGQHEFVGKEVTILRGEDKGQSGLCKQVTTLGARVLLKARSKMVTIKIDECQLTNLIG